MRRVVDERVGTHVECGQSEVGEVVVERCGPVERVAVGGHAAAVPGKVNQASQACDDAQVLAV